MSAAVELGCDYRDTVTGYTGTATARTEHFDGTFTVCLELADENGMREEVAREE